MPPLKPLNISYTNIRGLRSNSKDLQAYICNNKPDLFTLCESNLHGGIFDKDFLVPRYFPMHRKDSTHTHTHGLGMYGGDSLPIACDQISMSHCVLGWI